MIRWRDEVNTNNGVKWRRSVVPITKLNKSISFIHSASSVAESIRMLIIDIACHSAVSTHCIDTPHILHNTYHIWFILAMIRVQQPDVCSPTVQLPYNNYAPHRSTRAERFARRRVQFSVVFSTRKPRLDGARLARPSNIAVTARFVLAAAPLGSFRRPRAGGHSWL